MSKSPLKRLTKYFTPTVLGIFLAGFTIRLYAIKAPLVSDELTNASIWGQMPWNKILVNYQYPNNHIFHTILTSFILKFFGTHPIVIRIPVLITGTASLILTYLLTLRLFEARNISLWVLTLMAFAATPVYFSTNARGYSLLMFFALLTVWILYPILICPKRYSHEFSGVVSWRHCVLLATLWSLGTWTVPTFIYFEVALATWIGCSLPFTSKTNRSSFWKILICLLIAVIAFFIQYFVIVGPEMLKLSISNAATVTSVKFFPQLLVEWTRPWDSCGILFISFTVIGIVSTIFRNPRVGFLLTVFVMLPPLLGWLTWVLNWTKQIPDVRVFHYSIPFFYMLASVGILKALEWSNRLWTFNNGWEYSRTPKSVFAILLFLVAFWGIQDFFTRVNPKLKKREPYHEISNFIKSLGPYDLVLASNKHHIWFYLYGASETRKRIENILNSGKLSSIYFMACFEGKDTDAQWIEKRGRRFLKFEDFPPVQSLSYPSPHLLIPESLLIYEKKIGSFKFYKAKSKTIDQTARLVIADDYKQWLLPKKFFNKVQLSSANPTLRFQDSFYMLSTMTEKKRDSSSQLNLFLVRARIPKAGWLTFSNAHLKERSIEFDFTWRVNDLILDHPYGPSIFERPLRFWVFISGSGSGNPTIVVSTGEKQKTGIINGLAAFSINTNNVMGDK